MPVTAHTDGPAGDDVLHELAEHGLRHYIAQTANVVGVGPEAAWWEWADAPSAYIALDRRLPGHPDQDAALIWAAERGWAVAVETGCGEDLLITASLAVMCCRRRRPAPRSSVVPSWLTGTPTHGACPRAAVDTTLPAGWPTGPGTSRLSRAEPAEPVSTG